jgi:DnaK suppressor protein
LKDVRAALARIEDGSFGICMRCEEEIPNKRLKAVPWAAYCVPCMETIERQREAGEDDSDEAVDLAA